MVKAAALSPQTPHLLKLTHVLMKDNKSTMKAQIITLDILTKDININSSEKIKIVTDNN